MSFSNSYSHVETPCSHTRQDLAKPRKLFLTGELSSAPYNPNDDRWELSTNEYADLILWGLVANLFLWLTPGRQWLVHIYCKRVLILFITIHAYLPQRPYLTLKIVTTSYYHVGWKENNAIQYYASEFYNFIYINNIILSWYNINSNDHLQPYNPLYCEPLVYLFTLNLGKSTT